MERMTGLRPDEAIAAIATTQHGLLTRAQARTHLTEKMLRVRLRRGSLERIGPQVLGIAGVPPSWHRDVMAACLGSGGVASHCSAARLEAFRLVPHRWIEVTTGLGTNHRFATARIHQSNALAPHWITTVGPIPVTRPERTMVDLAGVLSRHRLELVLDAALDDRIVEIGTLIDAFDALAVRGRRGIAALRPMLVERGTGVVVDTTELERMFSAVLRDAGIVEPRRQVLLGGEALIGLVDFLFERVRLIVEVDGRKGHSQLLDFERDRRRDQIAMTQGLRVVRFTYRQISRRPWEVAEVMHALLRVDP